MKCKKPKMAEGGFLARSALKRGMKNTSPSGAARMGEMLDNDNLRRSVRGEPKMSKGGSVSVSASSARRDPTVHDGSRAGLKGMLDEDMRRVNRLRRALDDNDNTPKPKMSKGGMTKRK